MTVETIVSELKINKMTKAQYDSITPSDTEAYEFTDLSNILDGKQENLVSGVNIKTINNESLLGSGNINISGGGGVDTAQLSYYGTCATAAATQAKIVVCPEFTELTTGISIRVKFTNAQSYNGAPTLNVNSTGAKSVKSIGTTNAARYCWLAGEVVSFTYDGTNWIMEDAGIATTTYYGYTKLATSATSTNTATALTPASLNNLAEDMISGAPVYSASATYAVGDRVRYGYYIYECTTAITTAEAWNAAHWETLDPIQTQIDKGLNGKADVDLANVTDTGKILMSGMGMPSNTYNSLAIGASGTTYTAPTNGYFYIHGDSYNNSNFHAITVFYNSANSWDTPVIRINQPAPLAGAADLIPVKKGQTIRIEFSDMTMKHVIFVYAVGSESEAS